MYIIVWVRSRLGAQAAAEGLLKKICQRLVYPMKFKNMEIGTLLRLTLGFTFISITLLGSLFWRSSRAQWRATEGLYDHPLMVSRALGELKTDALAIQLGMKDIALAGGAGMLQSSLAAIDSADADASRQVKILRERYPGPITDVERLDNDWGRWKAVRAKTVRLVLAGDIAAAAGRMKNTASGCLMSREIMADLQVINEFSAKISDKFYTDGKREDALTRRKSLLAMFALLLLTLGSSWLLLKALRAPLRESEVRYRALFNSMSSGVAVYEAVDNGGDFIFTDFNPAAEKIDKKSRNNVVGRRVSEVFPGVKEFGLFGVFQRVWRTGTAEYYPQTIYREGDISRGWRENWVFRLPTGGLVAIYNDVTERRQNEEALRFTNTLLSTQLEASLDGVLIVDGAGKIISFNSRFVEIWGIAQEVIASRSDERALQAVTGKLVDPEEFLARVKYLYAHQTEKSREEVALRDGKVLDRYSAPMVGNDGVYYGRVWNFRDITDKKASEADVRDRESFLSSIVENIPDMVFIKDARELRFVRFNAAGEKLLGYKREELIGKNDYDFFPVEQAELFTKKDREVLSSGSLCEISEEEIDTKQGKRTLSTKKIPINGKDGRPAFLLGISRDITERKQADTAVREALDMQGVLNSMLQRSLSNVKLSEKLLSHLEGLFRLPWLAIEPKGAVFLVNARNGTLALTVQQGMAPAVLAACANVPLGRCLCGKVAVTGRTVESTGVDSAHDIVYAGMEPHGHYCTPIAAGGNTLGVLNLYLKEGLVLTESQRRFVKSVTDIMAENILHAQTQEKLNQSQKIESIGRLAGGVAHDFNNILTAIKCYAEFINKGLAPQDPKTEDVREIMLASDRAVSLTRQLLAFSRRQIMSPKQVDLNKCVADISNMLRRLIGEDITLSTKLSPEPCPALLDTGQIEQVLVNLVVNARDAMSGGGVIELATELLPPSEALFAAHPDLPRGRLVCLKVSDAGCGMTDEIKAHLFEPFFTTKDQGKGTGLGLATVFGIVKQSGGDIEVESEPGKGAHFRVFFAYCESAPGAAAGGSAPAAGAAKGAETILLVEDEQSLRHLGRRVLQSSGYIVLTAADGVEALRVLEQHGEPVDLLLTDVVMPGMSGRELGRQVALKKMAGRTLYMSGYTDDAIVKHGVLEPGLAFIYKPFTIDSMLAKVRAVLDAPADSARA